MAATSKHDTAKQHIQEALQDSGGVDDPGVNAALSGNLKETPRTKEALKRCGILMSELRIKPFQDFHRPTDNIEKQRLRYNHYETRRQAKLSLVLQERAKVFVEMTKKQTQNQTNTKSYQSMNMLEQILDREAGMRLLWCHNWRLLSYPASATVWYPGLCGPVSGGFSAEFLNT